MNKRVILITGGGTGIGKATAILCAKQGMAVAVAGRRIEKLQQVVDQIKKQNGKAIPIVCDVQDEQAVEKMFEKTIQTFGQLHAVFANAGYSLAADICQTSTQQVKEIFETNFIGTFLTAKYAVKTFEKNGGLKGKHILICSSSLSHYSIPGFGIYSATKAAQLSLAQSLHTELKSKGCHVSTVHPVGTQTQLVVEAHDGVKRQISNDNTPKLFIQTSQKVARAIIKCLKHPRRTQVWPSPISWPLFCIFHALPGITSALMRKIKKI